MKSVALAVSLLCALSSGCQSGGESSGPGPTRDSVVYALTGNGTLVAYISWRSLSAGERARIDAGETIGDSWFRIEVPYEQASVRIDLGQPGPAKFAEEFRAQNPSTHEQEDFRIDLVAGEPGLSGVLAARAGGPGEPNVLVGWSVKFDGWRAWYDGTTMTHLSFDSGGGTIP